MSAIRIYKDGHFAGEGRLTEEYEIVDCPAVLGPDQDASDDTYEAICEAISSEPQDADRYTGQGIIERPDGDYSWVIC